jgi:hypothetical protein
MCKEWCLDGIEKDNVGIKWQDLICQEYISDLSL